MVSRRKQVKAQYKSCETLIIDEISMIDAKFFSRMEEVKQIFEACILNVNFIKVARSVRNNDKPFGGIRLIITGDFLQLPPVTMYGQKPVFCFESEAWQRCIERTVVLQQVFRQRDLRFVNILNQVRIGE